MEIHFFSVEMSRRLKLSPSQVQINMHPCYFHSHKNNAFILVKLRKIFRGFSRVSFPGTQKVSHSIGDYKNVLTWQQCMSLMEKTEFQFCHFPIFGNCLSEVVLVGHSPTPRCTSYWHEWKCFGELNCGPPHSVCGFWLCTLRAILQHVQVCLVMKWKATLNKAS